MNLGQNLGPILLGCFQIVQWPKELGAVLVGTGSSSGQNWLMFLVAVSFTSRIPSYSSQFVEDLTEN